MVFCTLLALFSLLSPATMAQRERSFIMIKPDGVQRGLIGKIIKRFEGRGFKLVAMKFVETTENILKTHYADLSDKPFFTGLIDYMQKGPVVAMVWEGLNVVKVGRDMIGSTDPQASSPGTIRGDFCIQIGRNVIHGSDSVESAKKEIKVWFDNSEIIQWDPAMDVWIHEDN